MMAPRKYSPMKAVAAFHNAFGQKRYWDAPLSREVHQDTRMLRARLILEEATEAIEALGFYASFESMESGSTQQFAEIPDYRYDDEAEAHLLKELADVLVVTYGTADVMGIPLEDAYNEVMRSNMSKLGPDGKPVLRVDGKILKGPGYREADMHGVLTGEWL